MTSEDGGFTPESSWFVPALESIVRGESENLASYLHTFGPVSTLADTRASCRTHWVVSDANGRPRVAALATRLAEEVVSYCIPRSRIEEALNHLGATKSPNKLLRLQAEAKDLFSRLEKSGEGGELLLYYLLESYLGIPQILCKMSLKTNAQMHVHGVDGVHAEMLPDGTLAVYWGESKVYDDFGSAIAACFDSVEPFLMDAGGGPLQRDILLVRDNIDAGNRELTLALAQIF